MNVNEMVLRDLALSWRTEADRLDRGNKIGNYSSYMLRHCAQELEDVTDVVKASQDV